MIIFSSLRKVPLKHIVLGVLSLVKIKGVSEISIRTFYRAFAYAVDAYREILPPVVFKTDAFNPYSNGLEDALNSYIAVSINVSIRGNLIMESDTASRSMDWLLERYDRDTIGILESVTDAFIEGLSVPDALSSAS